MGGGGSFLCPALSIQLFEESKVSQKDRKAGRARCDRRLIAIMNVFFYLMAMETLLYDFETGVAAKFFVLCSEKIIPTLPPINVKFLLVFRGANTKLYVRLAAFRISIRTYLTGTNTHERFRLCVQY